MVLTVTALNAPEARSQALLHSPRISIPPPPLRFQALSKSQFQEIARLTQAREVMLPPYVSTLCKAQVQAWSSRWRSTRYLSQIRKQLLTSPHHLRCTKGWYKRWWEGKRLSGEPKELRRDTSSLGDGFQDDHHFSTQFSLPRVLRSNLQQPRIVAPKKRKYESMKYSRPNASVWQPHHPELQITQKISSHQTTQRISGIEYSHENHGKPTA